jgi:hypothetical protein
MFLRHLIHLDLEVLEVLRVLLGLEILNRLGLEGLEGLRVLEVLENLLGPLILLDLEIRFHLYQRVLVLPLVHDHPLRLEHLELLEVLVRHLNLLGLEHLGHQLDLLILCLL